MIRIYALHEQEEQIYQLHEWLHSKDLPIEHAYVDLNEDAKAVAEQYNLTVFPVLFELKNLNGKDIITKFADGKDIDKMSDDMIAKIKAELTPAE
jgi:hypothetical protein